MNERILRLAASHFPRDGEGDISATPEMIMEFAESIIKECGYYLLENGKVDTMDVIDMETHFGV